MYQDNYSFKKYIAADFIEEIWQRDIPWVLEELQKKFGSTEIPMEYARSYWEQLVEKAWLGGRDIYWLYERNLGRPPAGDSDTKTIYKFCHIHLEACALIEMSEISEDRPTNVTLCTNCGFQIYRSSANSLCSRCFQKKLNMRRVA